MIGGIVMILTVIWVYQSLMRAKKDKVLLWVSVCAVVFLVVQVLFYNINIMIIDGLDGKDVGGEYDRDLTSVGDRKTQEGAGGWQLHRQMVGSGGRQSPHGQRVQLQGQVRHGRLGAVGNQVRALRGPDAARWAVGVPTLQPHVR